VTQKDDPLSALSSPQSPPEEMEAVPMAIPPQTMMEHISAGSLDSPQQPVLPAEAPSSTLYADVSSVSSANLPGSSLQSVIPELLQSHPSEQILAPHQQVIHAVKLTMDSGRTEVSLSLKPEQLGDVRVTLVKTSEQMVSVRMVTQTAEARDALDQNMANLIRSLEDNGLQVGRVQVVHAGSGTFDAQNQPFQEQSQTSSHSQEQHESAQQHENARQQQSFNMLAGGFGQSSSQSAFTDGGLSAPQVEETSSSEPFDTDVEGEEASLSSAGPLTGQVATGRVDIRI
jgi:flagellar hook-length control protein FliK